MNLFKSLFMPSGRAPVKLENIRGEVTALATAGHYFIIATKEKNEIIVWDSTTRHVNRVFADLNTPASSVAASVPVGILASSDEQGSTVRLFDIESGEERAPIQSSETVTAMSFGASGSHLAFGHKSGAVGICDIATRNTTRTLSIPKDVVAPVLKEPPGKIKRLSFSSDGRFIAGVEDNGAILLWDLKDSVNAKIFIRPPHKFFSAQFSRDNRSLLTAGGRCSLRVNISGGKAEISMSDCGGVVSVYDLLDDTSKAASLSDEVIEDAFWIDEGREVAVQFSVLPPRDGVNKMLRFFEAANLNRVDLKNPLKQLKLGRGPLFAASAYCAGTSMFMINLKGSLVRHSLHD
jgi:WD40 repeat protein